MPEHLRPDRERASARLWEAAQAFVEASLATHAQGAEIRAAYGNNFVLTLNLGNGDLTFCARASDGALEPIDLEVGTGLPPEWAESDEDLEPS